MKIKNFLSYALFSGFAIVAMGEVRLTEDQRVAQWRERNVWPPQWQPETPNYSTVMAAREEEIMQLTGSDERWENWMQFVQGRMLPRFTPVGFEKIKTPAGVAKKLKDSIDAGLAKWDSLREEDHVADSIYGPHNPKMIDLGDIAWDVINELKPLHEAWAGGIELRPMSAYGVRMYREGASMVMHFDKPHTHVISSIIHIAHSYYNDDEPWPIEIEDHNGELHPMALQEGEMMFYESSVCLHGRMTQLKGNYYGSLFIHYMPVDKSVWNYTIDDVINNVPPHWKDGCTEEHGSRWAGQAITVDSRVVAGAPDRVSMPDFPAAGGGHPHDHDFYRDMLSEHEHGHEEL